MVNIVGAVFLRPDQVIGCKNHAPSPQFYPFFIFLNFIGISRKNVLSPRLYLFCSIPLIFYNIIGKTPGKRSPICKRLR
jgi:hypothetical protein